MRVLKNQCFNSFKIDLLSVLSSFETSSKDFNPCFSWTSSLSSLVGLFMSLDLLLVFDLVTMLVSLCLDDSFAVASNILL